MLRFRTVLLIWLCLAGVSVTGLSRDRGAAREAFQKASDYHRWLGERSESDRTAKQYNRAIYLYRLVIDHDPTYGACDDSLFAIASLYEQMYGHWQNPTYLRRAIYHYEFVAREYPRTRHKAEAITRASNLRNPPPAPDTSSTSSDAVLPAEDLAHLAEVRYWSNEDYTRVVLQLDREVNFEKSVLENPNRIYFDLSSTRVDSALQEREYDVNGLFIKRIRIAENRPAVVRVVLDFDQINQHTVFALYDPYRIVIDTRGKPKKGVADGRVSNRPADSPQAGTPSSQSAAGNAPVPGSASPDDPGANSAPSPTVQGNWTLTRTLGLKVGRVVIDPGHGGKDTGTIGPTGLREKDLVLAVSLQLKELLETRLGIEVILTRDNDRFIPLEERTAIANQLGADLFVSVHANASRNRKVSGIETYVLDFATNDAEREIASRENASSQRNIRDLEDLLKKIALEDYNQESRDLAHVVQNELVSGLTDQRPNQRNRGVKQAPFIVLIGSNMPCILTEIGFISNPSDEKYFKGDEARKLVAEALYKGIEAYFRSLGTLPPAQQASTATGR